jgi:hypothetical protein
VARTDVSNDDVGAKFLRNVGILHEPHGIPSQKTAFFIVTAVKTSNIIHINVVHMFIPNVNAERIRNCERQVCMRT